MYPVFNRDSVHIINVHKIYSKATMLIQNNKKLKEFSVIHITIQQFYQDKLTRKVLDESFACLILELPRGDIEVHGAIHVGGFILLEHQH